MPKILIVDDDRAIAELVSDALEDEGFSTVLAHDGKTALALIQQAQDFSLIILDIMIPQKTGLAVLHTIRQKSSVPILMLTAIGDEYTQVTSFDEQADDYITKLFQWFFLGGELLPSYGEAGKQFHLIL